MTSKQIARLLAKTNIELSALEISRDRVDVWCDDYDEARRIVRKVAKALGWSSTTICGAHAWAQPNPRNMGDWGDKTSRWHY